MTLQKTTSDNSVKHNGQSEQTKRDIKPNTIKNISIPEKQNKKLSQSNKKFIKEYITGEGFRLLKWIMNCHFYLKNVQILWLKKKQNHKKLLNLIKMDKQMQTFSFNPPTNLSEEEKWLSAVTSLEASNSVFNITNEDNSLSITLPGHWNSKSGEKYIDELNKLLELRSQTEIGLHAEEVNKGGNQILIGDNEYKLSDLDTQKTEIIEELKKAKYNDLEDLV